MLQRHEGDIGFFHASKLFENQFRVKNASLRSTYQQFLLSLSIIHTFALSLCIFLQWHICLCWVTIFFFFGLQTFPCSLSLLESITYLSLNCRFWPSCIVKLFSNSIKTDISKWKWTHDVVVIFARHPAYFGNLTSPMLKDSGERHTVRCLKPAPLIGIGLWSGPWPVTHDHSIWVASVIEVRARPKLSSQNYLGWQIELGEKEILWLLSWD